MHCIIIINTHDVGDRLDRCERLQFENAVRKAVLNSLH